MRRLRPTRVLEVAVGLAALVFLVGAWQAAVTASPRLAFFLGSPEGVGRVLSEGIQSGWLVTDTLVTGAEAVAGFIIGSVCGLLLGVALWWLPRFATLFTGRAGAGSPRRVPAARAVSRGTGRTPGRRPA